MSVVVSDVDTLMAYTVCNRRSRETHVNQVRNMAVTNIVDSDTLYPSLDYLIYNDPVAYAELVLNGDPETYLKTVTEYKPLDS